MHFAVRLERDVFAAEEADQPGNEELSALNILCRYSDDHLFRVWFLGYDETYDATDKLR
jgi:hypothetical protein